MILRKKIKWAFVLSVAFLAAYLFLAPVPLSDDFYFQPEWTRPIASALPIGEANANSDELRAFMLGESFGFFSPSGDIFKGDAGGMRFSAGGNAWCVYPDNAQGAEIYASDSSLIMTVNAAGFVHLTENGIYLFHPGGGAVSRYAKDGSLLWTREEAVPITTFSDSAAGAIIGYGNGLLLAVDARGENLFSFYPGGSDYQVVLGAALSNDGAFAICVSGISPQRVILIEIASGQHRITAHRSLDGNLRRQVFAGFSASGSRAFFETPAGLGILDTRERAFSELPLEGQVLNVVECGGTEFFAVLAKTDAGNHLLALADSSAEKAGAASFQCQDAFLLSASDGLYLGSDGNISKISIRDAGGGSR